MKLAYYPGCSLQSSAIEYDLSTRRTAEILGIELQEIEDFNCCGATSAHNTNKLLSLALPARNLAYAEQAGLNVLAPCAACYNRFRTTEHEVRQQAEIKAKVNRAIDMDYQAKNHTFSVLDLLVREIGLEKIKEQVQKPLRGMKAACYYGCLLVRPEHHTGFDDAEDPQTMDQIMQALGAETVSWALKTECCGAALATSRPDIGGMLIGRVLEDARENGAECIVTACPLCMMNLDMRQKAGEKALGTKFNMPIYYVTELLAIACGDEPQKVATDRHFVEAISYLESLPARAAEMDAAAAAAREKAGKKKAAVKTETPEDLEKKTAAFLKAIEKNPEKIAARLIDDEERAGILASIMGSEEKKAEKIAGLMAADMEKARKAADAYVTGELKKKEK